jgi:hypothetical protein
MVTPLAYYFEGAPHGEKARFAGNMDMSRGAFGDLIHGRRQPTLDQMRQIQTLTGGIVKLQSWATPQDAAKVRSPWTTAPDGNATKLTA